MNWVIGSLIYSFLVVYIASIGLCTQNLMKMYSLAGFELATPHLKNKTKKRKVSISNTIIH